MHPTLMLVSSAPRPSLLCTLVALGTPRVVDGRDAVATASRAQPSLVLLDLGAGLDLVFALGLCAALRRETCRLVLLCPLPPSEALQIRALESGADACLDRETPPALLAARLTALLRSLQPAAPGAPLSFEALVGHARSALLGDLVEGVVHDLNNPIACLTANLRTLGDYHRELAAALAGLPVAGALQPVLEDLVPLVSECLEGTGRMQQILKGLTDFSRRDPPVAIDIHGPLEGALSLASHALRNKVRLERSYQARALTVASASLLQQCFAHLVLSGAEALSPAREAALTVETRDTARELEISLVCGGADRGALGERLSRDGALPLAVAHQIAAGYGGGLSFDADYPAGPRLLLGLPSEKAA